MQIIDCIPNIKLIRKENSSEGYSEVGKSSIQKIIIKNIANAPFILKNKTPFTFETNNDIILISHKSTMEISLKTKNKIDVNNLTFYVLNAITAPKKYLEINLKL